MAFDIDAAMKDPFYSSGGETYESDFSEMVFETDSPTFYHDDPCGYDWNRFTLTIEQLEFVKQWAETHIEKLKESPS